MKSRTTGTTTTQTTGSPRTAKTQPTLTLFDASLFDASRLALHQSPSDVADAAGLKSAFEPREPAPSRPRPVAHRGASLDFIGGVANPDAGTAAALARRRRARARVAKRRYLADRESYERMEQARRALQLVTG